MKGVPDFQQHPLAILVPLVIPEPNHFDLPGRQKQFPLVIQLNALRKAVLETIQLHRQPCHRAEAIKNVGTNGMLTSKFETGKPSRLYRMP